LRHAARSETVSTASVRQTGLPHRIVVLCAATVAIALAGAIAVGALAVPDLAGALSDATRSLGGWIYLAVAALVFLETTALLGFMIHGELALLLGGVAAERGDASLVAMIALVCAAAVAGDLVSLLLGRRLGRPFLERHGGRVGLGAARLVRVDAFFARHGGKALFLARFTGFLRATMPFVAGSSGVVPRRLLPYSLASALVWTVTFTVLGYAFSESFADAGETATRVGLVGILLATTAFTVRSRWTRRDDEQVAVTPGAEPGRPPATSGDRDAATDDRRAV
jgi:membrane protein DedA with SNARE-associated domain